MRYLDEFRDPGAARQLLDLISRVSTKPVRLMEFCGGHTHAIFKLGLRQLLPPTVKLLSGPGCPVCVTSCADIDRAIAMAQWPNVIMTTFGDMMRVPGSASDPGRPRSLQEAKALGADVRMVYSTLDALAIAEANPNQQVVFLGIGFETTAPTVAAAVLQARAKETDNFSILCLHKLTPPATRAILDAGEVRLQGVLGPGHVTTIIGSRAWEFLPQDYGIPCAIAGFEPLDILQAIHLLVESIEKDAPAVRNAYRRSVDAAGNTVAQRMMQQVFDVAPAEWRGLGTLPASGLKLAPDYQLWDAMRRFPVQVQPGHEPKGCRCGEVLRGICEPPECPLFGRVCTPEDPVGPCMVSSEGACAAHLQYGGA